MPDQQRWPGGELIDISVAVHPASVVWPSAPRPELTRRLAIERGDAVNDSNLFMNVHTGTHIDAALHHFVDGRPADQIPLEALVGQAWVMDVGNCEAIDTGVLERVWPADGATRVLFRTRNSAYWTQRPCEFVPEYCALSADTADWLLHRGVRLVGIDYLSIERFGDLPTVHRVLLAAGVVLLEGLDLSGAAAGRYELLCLPLKVVEADGAPARAVLRRIA